MSANTIIFGTELKINVSVEPIGGLAMDSYDFFVELYCSRTKSIQIPKSDLIRVDENNYIARLDTNRTGAGNLKCRVTAYIPDADFEDNLRTEIAEIDTHIQIIKSI